MALLTRAAWRPRKHLRQAQHCREPSQEVSVPELGGECGALKGTRAVPAQKSGWVCWRRKTSVLLPDCEVLPVPREGQRRLLQKELRLLRLHSPSQGTAPTLWLCQRKDPPSVLSSPCHRWVRPGHPHRLHPSCSRPRRPGSVVTSLSRQNTLSSLGKTPAPLESTGTVPPQTPSLLSACVRDLTKRK